MSHPKTHLLKRKGDAATVCGLTLVDYDYLWTTLKSVQVDCNNCQRNDEYLWRIRHERKLAERRTRDRARRARKAAALAAPVLKLVWSA
jgi:pantothenate kinase-related protein Tda10